MCAVSAASNQPCNVHTSPQYAAHTRILDRHLALVLGAQLTSARAADIGSGTAQVATLTMCRCVIAKAPAAMYLVEC
jgi:hypothetical protein